MTHMAHELTDSQFRRISAIVYQFCGIDLKDGKEALVRARLMKRLRAIGVMSIDDYMKLVESPQGEAELSQMIDAMTTNKTSFFREIGHFDFFRQTIIPKFDKRPLRFWSAACSSGEEPYSLAMLLHEHVTDINKKDIRILATDISMRMLEKARRAVYSEATVQDIPAPYLHKYFCKIPHGMSPGYRISDKVQSMVRLANLNLMGHWPMKGPFQVIFCRNVMIYFDRSTQQDLVGRFWNLLETGGYLFVGHSEGLSGITHRFQYVKPAIYQKK